MDSLSSELSKYELECPPIPLVLIFSMSSDEIVSMSTLHRDWRTSGASIGILSSLLDTLMYDKRFFVVGESIWIDGTDFRLFSRLFMLSILNLFTRHNLTCFLIVNLICGFISTELCELKTKLHFLAYNEHLICTKNSPQIFLDQFLNGLIFLYLF